MFLVSQVNYQVFWYITYMIKINFAENLKNLRIGKNLTQAELAKSVGVDQRTISAWEKGICEPNFGALALLCELFEESFDDILT